jgi:cobalt-zinc-cadmium efflux system protein
MHDAVAASPVTEATGGARDDGHAHAADDGHSHGPAAHEPASDRPARVERRPLVVALAITSVFLVVEVIGAYLTNSLALLADAAHTC